jgi:hypothetical protein
VQIAFGLQALFIISEAESRQRLARLLPYIDHIV